MSTTPLWAGLMPPEPPEPSKKKGKWFPGMGKEEPPKRRTHLDHELAKIRESRRER